RRRSESNASACPLRAAGFVAGERSVQVPPSHSHVSDAPMPANNTVRPRAESYASACRKRADGAGEVTRWNQLLPSHSHVSPYAEGMNVLLAPPNSTVRPCTASYASACAQRGGGLCAGRRWSQLAPSHSQVSAST